MPLDTTSGNSILVSNSTELKAAYETLSTGSGGTILMDGDGGPYTIWLTDDAEGTSNVTFTAADPDNPPLVKQIFLDNIDNIRIDNVIVDSTDVTGRPDWQDDLLVKASSNVDIVNSEFRNGAEGYLDDASDKAETLGGFKWSDNVSFSNNSVTGYYHGLYVLETDGVDIIGNDITQLEGDGLRLGGVQNVMIADNYIHDFLGVDQKITHSDMIQFWGSNASSLSENV
ncbi:MAG: right-handed parallel beta-helix repeat-containing protein, partial [Paracoccaceae bacterium]